MRTMSRKATAPLPGAAIETKAKDMDKDTDTGRDRRPGTSPDTGPGVNRYKMASEKQKPI